MDSGGRYLCSVARRQRWTILGAVAAGIAGRAPDSWRRCSSDTRSTPASSTTTHAALWWACAGIAALGALEAVAGGARHFFAIRNRARADAGAATRSSVVRSSSTRAITTASAQES